MHCPSCNHDNRAQRRFCAECGAALAVLCAACGASNVPGEKFCGGCGASLRGSWLVTRDSSTPPSVLRATSDEPRATSPLSYTPKHLADKILQSKSALEGERKKIAELAGVLGDDVRRAQLPRQARQGYAEIGAPGHAARVARLLAESPR